MAVPATRRLRRRALAALTAVVGLSLAVVGPAGAAASTSPSTTTTTLDLHTQVSQNRQQRAQVGGQISSLSTSDAQVKKTLASIDTKLSTANASLAESTAAAQQADAQVTAAEAAEKAARTEAAKTKEQVKKLAIDAYVNPDDEGLVEVLASASIDDARERQSILQIRAHREGEILAKRRAALAQIRKQHDIAKAAATAAHTARDQQQQAISQLQSARNQQTQLIGDVDQRLSATLAEAAGLDAQNAQLAAQITQQQEELRAQVLTQQTITASIPTPAPLPSKSGSKPSTTTTTTIPPPPSGPVVPPPLYTIADMVNVGGGIYVNKIIATQVTNLLHAATSAGLVLTGSGFRDPQQQIQLRMQNCGTSQYAIYQEPSSQCSPPTAIPGTSMHEQGLAIDFDCSGSLIQSHSNPCWIWLNQNAATYGLYNLASEPWHWSVNGN